MEKNTYDVIIMGAGLSGIGTAYHLQKNCKGKSADCKCHAINEQIWSQRKAVTS